MLGDKQKAADFLTTEGTEKKTKIIAFEQRIFLTTENTD